MRREPVSAFASGPAHASTRALALLAVTFAFAAVTACGGGDDGTAARGTESGVEDAVIEVENRPERTMPLADIQEASIRLPGGPDWMTFHDGYVWVKRDDGIVTRIDPRTNKPNGEVRADTKSEQLCQGIGSGGGAVWSCSGSDVVRIDPQRLKVTASIPAAKIFDSGRFVVAGGKIWVLSGEGDRLVGIETTTASIGPTVELPVPCTELGLGADMVWVVCPRDGMVLGVDPASASVEAELELEEPSVAFGTKRDLWVGSAGSLVRVDLETLEPVARFADLDPEVDGDLAVDGDNVWVRMPAGILHRIDAASNAVAERIEPEDSLSVGAMIFGAGSVWTTASEHNVLLRLRPGGK